MRGEMDTSSWDSGIRDHRVWHVSASSSSPAIRTFTNVAPNKSHVVLNNGAGARPGLPFTRISAAVIG